MRTQAGVWIDRRKAVIVTETEDGEGIRPKKTKKKKKNHRTGDTT